MKKVGILTYHRATNYGAVLQAYSLQRKLQSVFPEDVFEIIDYSTIQASLDHKKDVLRAFRNGYASGLEMLKKNNIFSEFSNSLPISRKRIVSDRTSEVFKFINITYDLVIVGSDAVFSWNGKKFPTAYLLGEEVKVPKMSYAASSHRLYYRSSSETQRDYCKSAFLTYSYLGVRDVETENLIKYCCENECVDIKHNCDPTILLDVKQFSSYCSKEKIAKWFNLSEDRPIVVVMTPDPRIGEFAMRRFGKTHNVVSVFIRNDNIKNHCSFLTPFEWASLFSYAELTITEYFHATIFSLLNGTPTLSIDKLSKKSGYEGKIFDLLVRRLNLPDFYINIDDFSDAECESMVEHISGENYSERIKVSLEIERRSFEPFSEALAQELKQ